MHARALSFSPLLLVNGGLWGGGVRASGAAGPTVGLCSTSKTSLWFCVPAISNRAWRKNDPRLPPFISRFEEPSCWCRLEPRKRRANWKLILVWVPEMSAACVIPGAFVHSHHILRPWMRLGPFSAWFWEFSLLRAHRSWSERARCPPIITVASIIMGCYSHWWRQTSAHDWLRQLKRKCGKRFCVCSDSGIDSRFNAWSEGKKLFANTLTFSK